ncbi:hypothetical protein Tco_0129183 [Tanacetum coccineum]
MEGARGRAYAIDGGLWYSVVAPSALMSMGRVSETRIRRRRAKQSGGIDIEFKTVNEYSVRVNKNKAKRTIVVVALSNLRTLLGGETDRRTPCGWLVKLPKQTPPSGLSRGGYDDDRGRLNDEIDGDEDDDGGMMMMMEVGGCRRRRGRLWWRVVARVARIE